MLAYNFNITVKNGIFNVLFSDFSSNTTYNYNNQHHIKKITPIK